MKFMLHRLWLTLYRFWLTLDEWWFRMCYAWARSEADRSRLVMTRARKHMAALGFPFPLDLDIEEASRRLAEAARAIFIKADWIAGDDD